jgi:hypothetical protein
MQADYRFSICSLSSRRPVPEPIAETELSSRAGMLVRDRTTKSKSLPLLQADEHRWSQRSCQIQDYGHGAEWGTGR